MLRDGYGKTFKRVIIRMGRTDLRLGIDKLVALLEMEYGIDPMDEGTVYLFCGTRLDRIKGLTYEGGGYVLLTKRLTSGAFQWSRNADEAREMSEDDYERLMSGYTVESSIKTFSRAECYATNSERYRRRGFSWNGFIKTTCKYRGDTLQTELATGCRGFFHLSGYETPGG